MKEPTARQGKWIYYVGMFMSGAVAQGVHVAYDVPLVLLFIIATLAAMAGVARGYWDW